MKRYLVFRGFGLALFWMMLPLTGNAQAQLHVSGQLGLPIEEYGDNVSTVGGGLNLHFAVPVDDDWPLAFGADLGWMNIGNHEERIDETLTLSNPGLGVSFDVPLNYRIVTNSNFVHGHALARLRPPVDWRVVPYLDALAGIRYLYTRTRIIEIDEEDANYPDTEVDEDVETVVNADTHINDWVWSYGYGGGLQFRLAEGVAIDLRALWLRGTEAEYYDREDVESWDFSFEANEATQDVETDGTLTVEAQPRASRTDLVMVGLGFVFNLD